MSETDYLAALETGSTTRARCWRIARTDGLVLGFTDHDNPLSFDGVTYEASAALSPSEATASLGLSIDSQEAAGALSSAAITETDIRNRKYDGAEVRVFDVDWTNTDNRQTVGVYAMGEVARAESMFQVELSSRVADLHKRAGRRFLPTCDAQPGDARCGVDLDTPTFTGAGAVSAVSEFTVTVTGLDSYASGWFARGKVTWVTGANAGTQSEVRAFTTADGSQTLGLWRLPPDPIQTGDTFTVTAGCDRTWTTCRAKFGNGLRFRGHPHMPGESFPAEYPNRNEPGLDGGSRYA